MGPLKLNFKNLGEGPNRLMGQNFRVYWTFHDAFAFLICSLPLNRYLGGCVSAKILWEKNC